MPPSAQWTKSLPGLSVQRALACALLVHSCYRTETDQVQEDQGCDLHRGIRASQLVQGETGRLYKADQMSGMICTSKHSIHIRGWEEESAAMPLVVEAERDAGPSFFPPFFAKSLYEVHMLCCVLIQWTLVWLCLVGLWVGFLTPACLQGLCSITESCGSLVLWPGLNKLLPSHLSLSLSMLWGRECVLTLYSFQRPPMGLPDSTSPPHPHLHGAHHCLILDNPACFPLLHHRFNLDPLESHTDEMLWHVLERTFMRDTVGFWGFPAPLPQIPGPGASTWPS